MNTIEYAKTVLNELEHTLLSIDNKNAAIDCLRLYSEYNIGQKARTYKAHPMKPYIRIASPSAT